jgi:hypothetical protein
MKIYLAGPLFTDGERCYLDDLAELLGDAGHECFVPHQQAFEPFDAPTILSVDSAGIRDSQAMVAILDGPAIDDGTACEVGIYSELVRTRPDRYRGIVGYSVDWRLKRRLDAGMVDGGLNLFVAGAVREFGRLVWTWEDVLSTLDDWSDGTG